ncbi:hypothetical protein BKG94_07195 [Rodentibacter ratti]|uniref:hypothetical protein n=1 Tax=Rodentibacter ratti TaxID=1906745 RepID=UPI0009D530BC|nr:hypothetical protein [Rodentibacter ratti]OOF88309.1 hypothetical protein BKG94_07195 [Rodentibacter ratti]
MHKIPTHCALSMTNTGKVHTAIRKAKAILTLIQNDGVSNDELGGFFSSEKVIRDALRIVHDLLEQAEQSSKVDFYFRKEGKILADVSMKEDLSAKLSDGNSKR